MAKAPAKKTVKKVDSKASMLGEEKLKSSGLTLDDAKILGMSFLSDRETPAHHKSFKPLCSLKIEYFDVDGKPAIDWPQSNPFYRIRYLEVGTGFDTLSEKKEARYVQEPGTAPVAYFPRNQPDWPTLVANSFHPLIITEGELKAAKACKEGFPTIGIGGVYNWRANKLGLPWLPSMDTVVWAKRNVYIVYDSDYKSNAMVCHALRELAEELHLRGSFVHLVNLPQIDETEKVGLDDFLVQEGGSAAEQLRRLLSEAEPLGLTRPLWGLNEKYVYVQNPGLIINQGTKYKVAPAAFTGHLESTQSYQERQVRPDGGVSYKAVSASSAWLKWPLRREVSKLTYRPGQEVFITEKGLPQFNVWNGWGCTPKKGDVKPFLTLLNHLFTGAEKDAMAWFLKWCAYPIQHPGTKLFTSAVLHGIRHGTGKSIIGYTLGKIYGENFTEVDQSDLHDNFNEWAEGKQFVMGDDVTGSNKRQDADFLKKMITQRELRVNAKFIPSYTIPDCINYFFTANGPDSFFLEDDDRRMFIHEVQVGPLDEAFYMDFDLWLHGSGPSHLFHYLLELDTSDFNPSAPAFRTSAKERMINNVQSDLGAWCRQLVATPDNVLRVGDIIIGKDLYTSKELLQFYDPTGKTGTTANGLGRELARAGIRQVINGKPVKLGDGSQGRYYAIRRPESWLTAQPGVVTKHLDLWNKKQGFKVK